MDLLTAFKKSLSDFHWKTVSKALISVDSGKRKQRWKNIKYIYIIKYLKLQV